MTQTLPAGAVLEVDEEPFSNADSAFNDSIGSASYQTSISSSIINYKYENGRRYHAFREGAYTLPNDEEEQDRMDLGHHIYLLLLGGKLHLSPIGSNPQRVLDLGTGTGIWAIDFADQYPSAEVIGVDLSPIQPKWVPPNCIFEIDDFDNNWIYTRPFDFIHGRELMGFVADYGRLFCQAFKHLKSGGYLEMQTFDPQVYSDDGTLEKAKNLQVWVENLHKASEIFGKSMTLVGTWQDEMLKAGFTDIKSEIIKVPVGTWPKDSKLKELGKYHQAQVLQAIGSYTPALYTRVLGWSREEVEVLCAAVRNEVKDRSIHIYQQAHFVYGRKP
ncbi:hypothetical protein VTN77DRAFT_3626 [Rasamsonia byssochlamydoides]|uniref:uncharacterized protein n=1 Tax=Rasamsonia byssochlamydoides TaxID=89139 RepID=UPI00374348CC